jgi:hypothetical protein
MNASVFKTVQITGSSSTGSDHAVTTALERASKTIRNLRWFRVTDTRGEVENGRVSQWQVSIEVGFALD